MTKKENAAPSLLDHPWLRREAGEGWHPYGLNKQVLGAIVVREALVDEVASGYKEQDAIDDYYSQAEHVLVLKARAGIGDPPVTEVRDTPRQTE